MEVQLSETAPWVADQFAALSKGSSAPESIRLLQKDAYERFLALGIPTTGQEEWRYTNLTPVVNKKFVAPEQIPSAHPLNELITSRALPKDAISSRVVFVNGTFSSDLSSLRSTPGVSVTTLSQSGTNATIDRMLSEDRLFESEPFAAMNTALLQDVLSIRVEKGAKVSAPIEIIFLTVGQAAPISSFPRIVVAVDREASASIVERHLSVGGNTFCSSFTGFDVADGGTLEHILIQQLGTESSLVSMSAGKIGRDAKYHSHVFQLGASLVRNEIRPILAGVNGECLLNGISAINGTQHVDNYTVIDHATPHCFSREHYKGIYGDKSSGVFCGTIIVRQIAQKTNAVQSNKSLLLSNTATIDTKPQLKIWADDVKCTHGATVGQLDDDGLFYLRARGIPERIAKKMLIEAFVSENVEAIPGDALKEHLRHLLLQKLSEMT